MTLALFDVEPVRVPRPRTGNGKARWSRYKQPKTRRERCDGETQLFCSPHGLAQQQADGVSRKED